MQAEGNGRFVSITSDGRITTSQDGVVWSNEMAPFSSVDANWVYNGIIFANGQFVAFGKSIVIVGTAMPGSEWLSSLAHGGNWISAAFDGTRWTLQNDLGRLAISESSYPANWSFL